MCSQKLARDLHSVGHFESPPGGAETPYTIPENSILFELITEGAVYDFESPPQLNPVGSVFIHYPGQITISKTKGQAHYECFMALYQFNQPIKRQFWPRCFHWRDTDEALRFARQNLYTFHQQEMNRDVLGDYIWNTFRFQLELDLTHQSAAELPPRLQEVIAFIEDNYSKPLSIIDISDQVEISASHLHLIFKEFLEISPHQFLIKTRLKAAAHQLVASSAPIKAIAHDVGYPNTESFCRAFKSHYKRTAKAHRYLYQKHRRVE